MYHNGVIQFGSATPQPHRVRPNVVDGSADRTQAEVDLPAVPWVEGLYSFLKQSQIRVQAGAEQELPHGYDAREMGAAVEVLSAWRAELGVED